MHVCVLSQVRFFATPWTAADQAPLSMEFSRQEYWIGLPCSSPGDLPDPGIKPVSLALAGRFFTTVPPGKPHRPRKPGIPSQSHANLLAKLVPAGSWPLAWHSRISEKIRHKSEM